MPLRGILALPLSWLASLFKWIWENMQIFLFWTKSTVMTLIRIASHHWALIICLYIKYLNVTTFWTHTHTHSFIHAQTCIMDNLEDILFVYNKLYIVRGFTFKGKYHYFHFIDKYTKVWTSLAFSSQWQSKIHHVYKMNQSYWMHSIIS